MRAFRFSYACVATLSLFAAVAVPGRPQRGTTPTLNNPVSAIPSSSDPRMSAEPDPGLKSIEVRQQHARNDERQKRLVSDTDKLLALATQLHDDVGKTDKNILSLDVVKRAEEIEKLARSVKERMKG